MTKNVQRWITSDLHFYHKNILKLSPKTRGHFNDIHDMNEFFIEHWNNTVGPDDIIYYLGDFCFGSKKRCRKLLNRLNGRIYFILGNHDLAHMNVLKEQCESVSFYMTFMYMNTRIVLFHHPIHYWHSMEHGSIHLFGHLHGEYHPEGRCIDVGYDNLGAIIDFDYLVEFILNEPIIDRR
ncbi:hypothetical protein PBI_SCTP2_517 [Salicola phage SCTP-2]|nr:hypothetical protein PBI_SCTP2_517 [Salicola phage SCTP-2]